MSFAPPFGRTFAPVLHDALNNLLNGLVAYWPLNEAAGANDALDQHTSGLTLTQVSSQGADTGLVYATARNMDVTGDYFYSSDAAGLTCGEAGRPCRGEVY